LVLKKKEGQEKWSKMGQMVDMRKKKRKVDKRKEKVMYKGNDIL
jgi:hypothetical protein